ncbi:MAG: rhodanese-like domain-containing protein [Bacteroidales bacterium]|nr:rhodanese-like domain-containing protein [Bacteroidales bacterium]
MNTLCILFLSLNLTVNSPATEQPVKQDTPAAVADTLSANPDFKTCDPSEFRKLLKENKAIQLVDVRTPQEYKKKHIRKAVNIDVKADGFAERADSLLDKSRPVAVYCKGGVRSRKAAAQLLEKGFKVYNLEKGYDNWRSRKK